MKTRSILSLILVIAVLFTGCSSSSEEQALVACDSTVVVSTLDSIIKASDSIASSVKHTTRETDSAMKLTIQKFVYKNKLLSAKSLLVETVVMHDTVFIVETESKNFWGKKVKSRKMYSKKGTADSSSVLVIQDSVSVETDSSATNN